VTTKNVFTDIFEYGRVDLAGTFKSTAGSQEAVAPELLDRSMEALARDGFVVFERVLPAELLGALRAEVMPLMTHRSGRNNFEGFATQRLYAVIEKTLACNPLVEHPLVLGLLDRILEPNYLLSQLQAINILPGEAAQPLHYDDAFYLYPRPRRALGAATIWAIDPFTETNGATVVIPGSHAWGDRSPESDDIATQRSVVMPEGSLLFFVGTTWHGGGANRGDRSRLAVTAQYCAPYLRQQENFSLSVSRARARECSEHVQRMLGYSIYPPFMGFVNGMHPKRVLDDK
jgi:ectoine hydroxylase-related dioxygenase (phytanoyl-CoA dioxygenase family)